MTITEFLLARIDEDEEDTDRVLAECESKRRIVAAVEEHREGEWGGDPIHEAILGALALPYVDHPGYRPEWAP